MVTRGHFFMSVNGICGIFVSRETLGYSHTEKNTVRRHSVYTHHQQASPDGSQALGPLLSWEITFLTLSTVLGHLQTSYAGTLGCVPWNLASPLSCVSEMEPYHAFMYVPFSL